LFHAYAPREYSISLLALHALFCALEEALCRVSDESVAVAKLTWWHQQVLSSERSVSAHPITRQLYRSGVISGDTQKHLQGLLASTIERLDAPAPSDVESFRSLCRLVGLYPMRLELAMQGETDSGSPFINGACAVNGLVQLMRESSRSPLFSYSWLPLNLLARHGLTRDQFRSNAQPDTTGVLMQQLCELGLSWIENDALESDLHNNAAWWHRHRHWLIETQLNSRRLKTLQRLGLHLHNREFSSTRVGEAWLAWRVARKVRKAEAGK
jgi:hypothetical protein